MSNKTQLQTNNTKLSELIETLKGKAINGGDDTNIATCVVTNISSTTATTWWPNLCLYTTVDDAGKLSIESITAFPSDGITCAQNTMIVLQFPTDQYRPTVTFTSDSGAQPEYIQDGDCLSFSVIENITFEFSNRGDSN